MIFDSAIFRLRADNKLSICLEYCERVYLIFIHKIVALQIVSWLLTILQFAVNGKGADFRGGSRENLCYFRIGNRKVWMGINFLRVNGSKKPPATIQTIIPFLIKSQFPIQWKSCCQLAVTRDHRYQHKHQANGFLSQTNECPLSTPNLLKNI